MCSYSRHPSIISQIILLYLTSLGYIILAWLHIFIWCGCDKCVYGFTLKWFAAFALCKLLSIYSIKHELLFLQEMNVKYQNKSEIELIMYTLCWRITIVNNLISGGLNYSARNFSVSVQYENFHVIICASMFYIKVYIMNYGQI